MGNKNLEKKKKRSDFNLSTEALRKKVLIIMWLNVGFFTLLSLGAFIVIIFPFIQWMYDLAPAPLYVYLIRVWYIGIPLLSAVIIYGATLFWPLLVKFNRIKYKGHDICVYLGVKNIVINVDGKNVTSLSHGFYSCPTVTWYVGIDDEYFAINIIKKSQYKIELNCQPTKYQRIDLKSSNIIEIPKKKKKAK